MVLLRVMRCMATTLTRYILLEILYFIQHYLRLFPENFYLDKMYIDKFMQLYGRESDNYD